MGSRLTETNRGGLIVADQRCIDTTNLAANDGTANNSQYTEAGPRPGSAVTTDPNAKLRPLISGGQSTDADIYVNQGGFPARDGLRAVWRADGDADEDWRGWNHPIYMAGWACASWTTDATGHNWHDVAVIPSTQEVICAYRQQTASRTSVRLWGWDSPGAWGAEVDAITGGLGAAGTPALLVIPGTERILLFSVISAAAGCFVHYSDDKGATWAPYAADAFLTISGAWSTAARMRAAYQSSTGNILLVVEEAGSTGDISQYASNDLGVTFTLVGTITAEVLSPSVFSIPGTTQMGMIYMSKSDDLPYFIPIASPYDALSGNTPVAIDASTTVDDITGYADHDGNIYAIGRGKTAGLEDAVRVWRSTDLGVTWMEYQFTSGPGNDANLLYSSGDTTTYPTNFAAVAAGGQAVLMHNWESSGNTADKSLGSMWLGGFSSLSASHGIDDTLTIRIAQEHDEEMMGWGWDNSSKGRTYLPFDLPDAQADWTVAGAGTGALAAGALNISTTANTLIYTHASASFTDGKMMFAIAVKRNSGPGGGTLYDVADIIIENGANDQHITLQISSTGYNFYDEVAAANIGTAAVVDLSDWLIINVLFVLGDIDIWHHRIGDSKVTLGPVLGAAMGQGAVAAASRIRFGHLASVTADTDVRMLCWKSREESSSTMEQFLERGGTVNPGRTLTRLPYPIPDIGTSTAFAFLSAQGGSGRIGDTWDIDTEHDHPIEHCLPGLNPGTDKFLRTTDKTELRIVFTLGADATDLTRLGGGYSLGVGLIGCRGFATFYLDGYTTAGGWSVLGTGDLSESIPFMDKIGDVFAPSLTEIAAGSRFIRWGEYVGGYLVFDEGNSSYEIEHHNGGWWARNTTTAGVHFRVTSPSVTANGTDRESNTIVSPSGVLVVHQADRTVFERYRIRVPASETSPWSYYQIGAICLGGVSVPGQQPSNGWSKRQRLTNETTTSRSGSRRIKELGRAVWDWSWSWVDGMLHSRLAIDADYRGSSAGAPLTMTQDVFHWLAGLVRHDLKSGEVVCIALEEVPDADSTITAPDLFNYGTLSPVVHVTQIQGSDGRAEMVRVESVLHRGLP